MGAHTGKRAVADAVPLIHLNEIGSLSLLYSFDEIHVSDTVWAEVIAPNRVESKHLAALTHLRRHRVLHSDAARFVTESHLSHLHFGEQTSLYLLDRLKVKLFLTDDLAARDAAKILGFRPIGSLGVIVRACMDRLIEVESAVQRMRDLQEQSTLFVTGQIVESAIETLYLQLNR